MFKYPCNFQSFLRFPKVMVIRYRFSSLNLFTLVTPKQPMDTFIFFNINHLTTDASKALTLTCA